MKPALSGLLVLGLASSAWARQEKTLQIRARELWAADGKHIANGLLVIEGGRIRDVGDLEPDPRWPLILHDGVLTAGLVACQTASGAAGELLDDTRSVLPEARTAFAFEPRHPDFGKALAAGVTTLVLAPGGENLVGGLSSAVKTAGARVLSREASLALSFSSAALGRSAAPSFLFFGAAEEALATPDGGPETTRSRRGSREPTSYPGALAELRRLFAGEGEPFARAGGGELPVYLEAWDRHEVVRAARFAREYSLQGAIRGAPLAGDPDVLAAIRDSGLGVILGPWTSDQARRSLASLAALSEAGIPVAFALDAPAHDPSELRLFAARALWAGASREAVWKALTSDAARLAGVGEDVGEIASGKDADFVLWSGDPLNLATRPLSVWVDGELRWPEHTEREKPE